MTWRVVSMKTSKKTSGIPLCRKRPTEQRSLCLSCMPGDSIGLVARFFYFHLPAYLRHISGILPIPGVISGSRFADRISQCVKRESLSTYHSAENGRQSKKTVCLPVCLPIVARVSLTE